MKKLILVLCVLGFMLPSTIGCKDEVTQPETVAEPPEEESEESMTLEAEK